MKKFIKIALVLLVAWAVYRYFYPAAPALKASTVPNIPISFSSGSAAGGTTAKGGWERFGRDGSAQGGTSTSFFG